MLRSRHRRSKLPQARVVPPHEAFPSQVLHACLHKSAVSADMSDMIVRTGQNATRGLIGRCSRDEDAAISRWGCLPMQKSPVAGTRQLGIGHAAEVIKRAV